MAGKSTHTDAELIISASVMQSILETQQQFQREAHASVETLQKMQVELAKIGSKVDYVAEQQNVMQALAATDIAQGQTIAVNTQRIQDLEHWRTEFLNDLALRRDALDRRMQWVWTTLITLFVGLAGVAATVIAGIIK